MAGRLLIMGGGLAGLATAAALAPRGWQVTLLESRRQLGGRATSFTEPATGQIIDQCQHVSMGCCTNFSHFCKVVGIDHLLERVPKLFFMTADGQVSEWCVDGLPAPWHLIRTFLRAHFLSRADKLRIGWALTSLERFSPRSDPPFMEWLEEQGQSLSTIQRFWNVILVSALNESIHQIGLKYARKVFVDGFMRHREGSTVYLPKVPLGEFYGAPLSHWLRQHQVTVSLETPVRQLLIEKSAMKGVLLRDGSLVEADVYLAAVPFYRLLDLIPTELVLQYPLFTRMQLLKTSPITSVHLWFDQPITHFPHLVMLDGICQWLFHRPWPQSGEFYYQVVISAARDVKPLGGAAILEAVLACLQSRLPPMRNAHLIRSRVITEQQATFSVEPGVDRWRPDQRSPIAGLYLAGDWTATGWPATMEGAVRSGYLAAEAIMQSEGQRVRFLQPDLV